MFQLQAQKKKKTLWIFNICTYIPGHIAKDAKLFYSKNASQRSDIIKGGKIFNELEYYILFIPWYPFICVPLSTVNTLIGLHDKPGQMYAPLIKQCVLIMILPKAFKYFCYYALLYRLFNHAQTVRVQISNTTKLLSNELQWLSKIRVRSVCLQL